MTRSAEPDASDGACLGDENIPYRDTSGGSTLPSFKGNPSPKPSVLATDLDGTFVPLQGNQDAVAALQQIVRLVSGGPIGSTEPTAGEIARSTHGDEPANVETGADQMQTGDRPLGGGFPLLYVTGRHFEFVLQGIVEDGLPLPDWILCDVGTSFFQRVVPEPSEPANRSASVKGADSSKDAEHSIDLVSQCFERITAYDDHLQSLIGETDVEPHRVAIGRLPGFRLQEDFKQGRFKLSYYVPAERLDACRESAEAYIQKNSLEFSIISSVDPFNGDGLIDLLPAGVSKAYALDWWRRIGWTGLAHHVGLSNRRIGLAESRRNAATNSGIEANEIEKSDKGDTANTVEVETSEELDAREVVFCGDSGNDFAALVAGYRAVVVGNADRKLACHVFEAHAARGWKDRLYLARRSSTAGVLDGLRWYGMLPSETSVTTPTTDVDSAATAVRLPNPQHWGAVPVGYRTTRFRVWAPHHDRVAVELLPDDAAADDPPSSTHRFEFLENVGDGFFEKTIEGVPAKTKYRYRLSQDAVGRQPTDPPADWQPTLGDAVPDPASRCQPDGVHGPSVVVHDQFPWRYDEVPRCTDRRQLLIYELHVGTFTDAGTFVSAIDRLDELVELGVTAIELMPVVSCPGRWNWGYDGVDWFAPMAALGTPDDLRMLVDEAHRRGLSVLLDVVYNHFGPEGNYTTRFGPYASARHHTAWGAAPNFDDDRFGQAVRRMVIDNAVMWLQEYHFDGLRVDAIHCMADDSDDHITTQLAREIRQWAAARQRHIWLIAETNVFDPEMTRSFDKGGTDFDAQWSDDFVHSVFATLRPQEQLTHRTYRPAVDLAETLRRGFLFTGNVRGFRGRAEAEVPSSRRFDQVVCIQNHDFIGNHPLGRRLHQITSLPTQAAAATLMLLSPSIPMLFMGEEFACERRFRFFVDFQDEAMRRAVVEGRRREYPQHDWSDGVSPVDPAAMSESKIGPVEDGNAAMRGWYQRLIQLRRQLREKDFLHPDRMQVSCDLSQSWFRIDYDAKEPSAESGRCALVVRLTPPGVTQSAPWPDHLPSCVVADSIEAFDQVRSAELQPNHARLFADEPIRL